MPRGLLVIGDLRRYDFDNMRMAYVRSQFSERVGACLGYSVILYQSRSRRYLPGYFAVATLLEADMAAQRPGYISLMFDKPVYFRDPVPVQVNGPITESYVRNDKGSLHGRRFAEDFRTLLDLEFDELVSGQQFFHQDIYRYADGLVETEERIRQRVARESWQRSIKARSIALPAYQFACAITGQKLISRNGQMTGLQVCHVLSVASGGLDICSNLVVLSPDFHVRYDQGSIDILDDYTWVALGDTHDPIVLNWKGPRKLYVPEDRSLRLDPRFLAAHRRDVVLRQGIAS
jgi:hypothetical protein